MARDIVCRPADPSGKEAEQGHLYRDGDSFAGRSPAYQHFEQTYVPGFPEICRSHPRCVSGESFRFFYDSQLSLLILFLMRSPFFPDPQGLPDEPIDYKELETAIVAALKVSGLLFFVVPFFFVCFVNVLLIIVVSFRTHLFPHHFHLLGYVVLNVVVYE